MNEESLIRTIKFMKLRIIRLEKRIGDLEIKTEALKNKVGRLKWGEGKK